MIVYAMWLLPSFYVHDLIHALISFSLSLSLSSFALVVVVFFWQSSKSSSSNDKEQDAASTAAFDDTYHAWVPFSLQLHLLL